MPVAASAANQPPPPPPAAASISSLLRQRRRGSVAHPTAAALAAAHTNHNGNGSHRLPRPLAPLIPSALADHDASGQHDDDVTAGEAVQPLPDGTHSEPARAGSAQFGLLHSPKPLPQLQPFLDEPDSPFQWLYQPHTVSGLLAAVATVGYFSLQGLAGSEAEDAAASAADPLASPRRAILLVSIVFLVYCSIQLRDSMLVRPHPVVWRLVHGVGLLYLLALMLLLAHPPHAGRGLLRVFDASLGPRPEENDRLYATDCRVYTPGDANGPFARIKECVFDIFVVAHVVGWFAKALLLRDWRLGWLLSVLWEIIELTFQKVLPNFHECWWDHWVIDVILSNGAGLVVGMWVVEWLHLRPFDWTGRERVSPIPKQPLGQLAGLLQQLAPYEFTRYQWRLVDSPSHLLAAGMLVAIIELIELNAFFLKYVLYVPPASPLNVARLVVWFSISLPATREFYSYATDAPARGRRTRMGPNMWLALTLAVSELLVVVKYGLGGGGVFPPNAHIPEGVLLCWAAAACALGVWMALRFAVPRVTGARAPAPLSNAAVLAGVAALAHIAVTQDVWLGQKGEGGGGGVLAVQ